MNRLHGVIRASSVTVALAGVVAALRFALAPLVAEPDWRAEPPRHLAQPGERPNGRPDSVAAAIAARNPFRADRRPTDVAYDPTAGVTQAAAVEPPPARPVPTLTGIVLGPEAQALVAGLPGVSGTRVLRVGERVGAFRLRAIRGATVVIDAPDTSWTLRLKGSEP